VRKIGEEDENGGWSRGDGVEERSRGGNRVKESSRGGDGVKKRSKLRNGYLWVGFSSSSTCLWVPVGGFSTSSTYLPTQTGVIRV
jgi:hypothetical protein